MAAPVIRSAAASHFRLSVFLIGRSRAAKPLLDFSQALFKNFHPTR
jgi:hypothetical protein